MVSPLSLPPKDAIAFFRSKGMRQGFDYQDVWQEEHAKAFTVAKAMSVDILEDIRGALDDALTSGLTLEQFKKQLTPTLQAKGWWGKKEMTDPATGEARTVQLGSPRRLRTIYEVNLRSAYAHGNWQRIEASKTAFPYLQYSAILDFKTRPRHRAWNGVCKPVDDPFWDTHYPPCGWRCRCGTRSLTRRQVEREGIDVNAQPPRFPMVQHVNSRTGEVITAESGIDPAFNYNVGKAPLRALTARPVQIERNRPVKDIDKVTAPFFKAAGIDPAKGAIVQGRDNWPLAISRDLFIDGGGKPALPSADVASLPLVAKALRAPDAMNWHWASEIREAGERQALNQVLRDAASTGDHGPAVLLGPLAPDLIKAGLEEGVDLSGFRHGLDAGAVRHALAKHGDVAVETARGQAALTEADIRLLPSVIASPDHVVFGLTDQRGQPTLGFVKKVEDGTLFYIAQVRSGRRELAGKTVWKVPAGADAKGLVASLVHNARNGGGVRAKVVDTTGKINPARDAVVRRYTKRLDNQSITVDFSAGAWTYDVRLLSAE